MLALAHAALMTGPRAMAINHRDFSGAENWMLDPFAYDQAVKATNTVLVDFRLKGEINVAPVYDFANLPVKTYERIGEEFARAIFDKIGKPDDVSREAEVVQAIAPRLSDIIPAMRTRP